MSPPQRDKRPWCVKMLQCWGVPRASFCGVPRWLTAIVSFAEGTGVRGASEVGLAEGEDVRCVARWLKVGVSPVRCQGGVSQQRMMPTVCGSRGVLGSCQDDSRLGCPQQRDKCPWCAKTAWARVSVAEGHVRVLCLLRRLWVRGSPETPGGKRKESVRQFFSRPGSPCFVGDERLSLAMCFTAKELDSTAVEGRMGKVRWGIRGGVLHLSPR